MKLAAFPALGPALAVAALALHLSIDTASAQSNAKAPAPSKARQEAEARMSEELAREAVAAAALANARQQAARDDAARAARVAAALAAPIVQIAPFDAGARGAVSSGAPAAGASAATSLAGVNGAPAGAGVAATATSAVTAAAPAPALTAANEQRLALVIGNSSYRSSPLTNPVNDARAMAIKLQQLGFTVIKKENADREEMMNAVREFGNQLRNGGVGLFYYAGHGIQSKGSNYLVPVDADIRNEDELATRAYNANEVLEKMDTAKNRINMVVLDACRDNPFARSFRSGSRGLAGMDQTPTGTLVAYATSPGSTASDGLGANGLYTEQLLRAMSEPGLKLEDVFKRVRVNVVERSEGKQLPWEMSSVTGDFYFNPTSEQVNMAIAVAGGGGVRLADQPRQLMPVLISRKLIEHYQLTGSFPLQGQPAAATYSHDGAAFAVAGKDRTLRSFDSMTGALTATETNYSDAALNGNRRALVGLAAQGRITMHELAGGLAKRNLDTLPGGALQVALSPNGKRLLVFNRDKGFQLYDADTLALVAQLDAVDGAARFLFAPDGERLLTWGERDSNMKLWESASGKRVARLSDHWNAVGMVRFSADGATIFSASLDDKAVFWRASDGETIRKFELGDGNPLPQQAEVVNKGKQVLAYVQRSAKVQLPAVSPMQLGVWDAASGRLVANLLPDGVTLVTWRVAHEQGRVFINASDRNLYVVDLATLQRVGVLGGLEFIDLSPDGRRFLVKNADGVRLMDLATMAPMVRMAGQVHAVAAARGHLFATCAPDGTVTLWNFDNGEQVGQLKGHLDTVSGVVFADDGRHLATLGADNMAKLWAIPEIKDMQQLVKDQFESTTEYNKRMVNWSSPYTSLVTLAGYNADAETFNVRFGDITAAVPLDREKAKKLMGQRQAIITAKLRFFDGEQLILADSTLTRLP